MTNIILTRDGVGNPTCHLIAERSSKNLVVVNKDVDQIPPEVEFTIRWATTSGVIGKKINKAPSIHNVYDKVGFRKTMREYQLCPPTFVGMVEATNVWPLFTDKHFPIICRPSNHMRGVDFYKLDTFNELKDLVAEKNWGEGFYISPFINKSYELRVMICGGRVLWVCENNNAERKWSNVKWSKWHMPTVESAMDAFSLSGLDFGAVDVMIDANGIPWVSEINSGPEILGDYQPRCMAMALDDLIENYGKESPYPILNKESWKNYIHPVLTDKAL